VSSKPGAIQPFDIELFLAGVLTGSHVTRQRHVRQAKIIQAEIAQRWQREAPWTWQRKHLVWFLEHYLDSRSESTCYYYLLTVRLLARRLKKQWVFRHMGRVLKHHRAFIQTNPTLARPI